MPPVGARNVLWRPLMRSTSMGWALTKLVALGDPGRFGDITVSRTTCVQPANNPCFGCIRVFTCIWVGGDQSVFSQLYNLVTRGRRCENATYLLEAHLASFLDAIVQGHISQESARSVRDALAGELRTLDVLDDDNRRTAQRFTVSALWDEFGGAVRQVGEAECPIAKRPHKLADSRPTSAAYDGVNVVTVSSLLYFLPVIRLGAAARGYKRLTNATKHQLLRASDDLLLEAVACIRKALEGSLAGLSPFLKGVESRTVWIAPVEGHVESLVSVARDQLLEQHRTDALRDLLGLWELNGATRAPVIAFFLKAQPDVFAPNVITAGGYARFRHRPAGLMSSAPSAGLTYNLDREEAKSVPGAAEIVAIGVKFKDVANILGCRRPKPFGMSANEITKSHEVFAAEVANGLTLPMLLAELERNIP